MRAVKDVTRSTELLAIGSGALNHVPTGALLRRLETADRRGITVFGEARLLDLLGGGQQEEEAATIDPASVAEVGPEMLLLLNAFDLLRLSEGLVRFADAEPLRTSRRLLDDGFEPGQIIAALLKRQAAPKGRHRLSLLADGSPVLIWEDGVTTVTGQGVLPLDEGDDLETLFEDALEAESAGDLDEAARLYDLCARYDRQDPIAPFNLGNVLLRAGDTPGAKLAFTRALARRAAFPEAHFNLAHCLEEQKDLKGAQTHLEAALKHDPGYADAMFNLAQIELSLGQDAKALALFRAFAGRTSSDRLKAKATRAIQMLEAQRS